MCGIVGYIGKKEAAPVLISGLKRLEYRGYDSAGLCLLDNGQLFVVKKEGPISSLEAVLNEKTPSGLIGIGHTRWATHGRPNEVNAHPHCDCSGRIAIVHNGIIENYAALKSVLEGEGHKFLSETDSEVIAHLIEKFYSGNLEEAVLASIACLEGTFGLAAICADENRIVAARRGSPLMLGIGEDSIYIASDASAVIGNADKAVYLKDNEMAIVSPEGYVVKDMTGEVMEEDAQEILLTLDEIEKGGFKHFMLKEIFEQPETVADAMRGRLNESGVKLSIDVDPNRIKRIIITACGTSWHSALIGKYLIEKIAGIPVEVDYASEFRYRNPIIRPDDLMIVISQSGETADTLAALRLAKGGKTLGIINVVGSTISREVDFGIYLHAGPEIGVASTKAFTSQVVSLILLSLQFREKLGLGFDSELARELLLIPEKIREVLSNAERIESMADNFTASSSFLYLGRGINFPTALEGALKLKEVSYIHAEGYPAAEMKHGPIALIDENMFVVFIVNSGPIFDKVISNMQEVKARGGRIISITDSDNPEVASLSEFVIKVPSVREELSPLINVIPLQILAYHIADKKGVNVDKPRNLAKSVTVE